MQENVEMYKSNFESLFAGILLSAIGLFCEFQFVREWLKYGFNHNTAVYITPTLMFLGIAIFLFFSIDTKPIIICCTQGLIIRKRRKEIMIKWGDIKDIVIESHRHDGKTHRKLFVKTKSGEFHQIVYVDYNEALEIINDYRNSVIKVTGEKDSKWRIYLIIAVIIPLISIIIWKNVGIYGKIAEIFICGNIELCALSSTISILTTKANTVTNTDYSDKFLSI